MARHGGSNPGPIRGQRSCSASLLLVCLLTLASFVHYHTHEGASGVNVELGPSTAAHLYPGEPGSDAVGSTSPPSWHPYFYAALYILALPVLLGLLIVAVDTRRRRFFAPPLTTWRRLATVVPRCGPSDTLALLQVFRL